MRCAWCRAADRWTLTTDGWDAWVTCGHGHRSTHPLVYPALIRVITLWQRTPSPGAGPAAWAARLQRFGWRPTGITHTTAGTRGWDDDSPLDWAQHWPHLVAAENTHTRHILRQACTALDTVSGT